MYKIIIIIENKELDHDKNNYRKNKNYIIIIGKIKITYICIILCV